MAVRRYPVEGPCGVDQLDDTTLRWRVAMAGATREFVADITTQEPDACVAWVSREGPGHSGTIRFSGLPDGSTRVEVEMDDDTETWTDTVACMLNLVDMQVKDDLRGTRGGLPEGPWSASRGGVDRPVRRPDGAHECQLRCLHMACQIPAVNVATMTGRHTIPGSDVARRAT